MATNFPTSLDTSTELPAEGASTPLSTNHVTAHQNIQDALEAVEAKIGVDSSAVVTSLDYLVKNTSSSNPGHKHTLADGATDITASTAQVNVLATGYYDATSSVQTQINTKAPTASPTFTGLVTTPAIKITTGASAGYFLQSDADGDASWAEASATADVQTFTADGTWTKPAGAKSVTVICIGSGGGGGSGCKATSAQSNAGAGGGGGAVTIATFKASDLDSTEAIVVGGSVAGGVAQTTTDTAGNDGIIGVASSFGTRIKAGGGGIGKGGTLNTTTLSAGGGGGGSFGTASGITGGVPSATTDGIATQGATAPTNSGNGRNAEYGGASGGGGTGMGGSSIYGGGGGGSGGAWNGTGTSAGNAGGTVGAYTAGGGGAGGANTNNSPGTAGSANSVLKKGYGGAGGGGGSYSGSAGTGGTGGAGGIPGGGGGGGGGTDTGTSGAGGAGARGEVTVITYF